MITIQSIIDHVKAGLSAPYSGYEFQPGINPPNIPIPYALFSRLEGPGLDLEGVMDRVGLRVEVVGQQHDYNSGESFAMAIDRALLAPIPDLKIGTTHVTHVDRFGGGPYEFEYDDAERYHFVCSYVLDVESGMVLY